jgi:hypothetical protein
MLKKLVIFVFMYSYQNRTINDKRESGLKKTEKREKQFFTKICLDRFDWVGLSGKPSLVLMD